MLYYLFVPERERDLGRLYSILNCILFILISNSFRNVLRFQEKQNKSSWNCLKIKIKTIWYNTCFLSVTKWQLSCFLRGVVNLLIFLESFISHSSLISCLQQTVNKIQLYFRVYHWKDSSQVVLWVVDIVGVDIRCFLKR